MNHTQVKRIGKRTDACLLHIRESLCRIGTMGEWHLQIAAEVLKTPDRADKYISLMEANERDQFLSGLSSQIKLVRKLDRRCEKAWKGQSPGYGELWNELHQAFLQFSFSLTSYERHARSEASTHLQEARRLKRKRLDHPEVILLQELLRMTLNDFITLKSEIMSSLVLLDSARMELSKGFRDFALKEGIARGATTVEARSHILFGLDRATVFYDYKRGYHFDTYAIHWIERAIEKWKETK